ncbi:cyclin-dependent kinase inhibitor 1 isoform X2 [Phascolarctos cinereus]|nr:cyclin-dependent kinase inhibitor 1 isoform X2 [Phascolarctos cinereus]XP_020855213.1 cyclin-dependent kinase inhibitor 1 isoform X2 [Phascolarctos cinereus]XP_020855215.1 cyclin-dependent kinase inhibitor 1 isoform X2 [Phascolarctos cinereus]
MSESPSRTRQIPCSGKLCRNLFGPVDHEQLQQDCQDLMQSCTQEAQRRWNFDFVTETPLDGDFAWERVRGLDLPSIYRPSGPWGREDLGGKRPKPQPSSPALLQMSAQGDHVDLSLSCTVVPLTPEREEGSKAGTSQPTRKHKQTSMTDFYHSKRRLIFYKRKP